MLVNLKEWITGRNPVYEVLRARRRISSGCGWRKAPKKKAGWRKSSSWRASANARWNTCSAASWMRWMKLTRGWPWKPAATPTATWWISSIWPKTRQEPLFVLILDVIQNPQNLGTLLRTAEAVGVHGVLLPFRHAAGVTPAVVNASSGASEHLLLAQLNLAQAIADAQRSRRLGDRAGRRRRKPPRWKRRAWMAPWPWWWAAKVKGCACWCANPATCWCGWKWSGKIESLNAAVAGSIALYLAHQARVKGQINRLLRSSRIDRR